VIRARSINPFEGGAGGCSGCGLGLDSILRLWEFNLFSFAAYSIVRAWTRMLVHNAGVGCSRTGPIGVAGPKQTPGKGEQTWLSCVLGQLLRSARDVLFWVVPILNWRPGGCAGRITAAAEADSSESSERAWLLPGQTQETHSRLGQSKVRRTTKNQGVPAKSQGVAVRESWRPNDVPALYGSSVCQTGKP
jgi:hypothetical protein